MLYSFCSALGGVTFMAQLAGTLLGIGVAIAGGVVVYGGLKLMFGIRLWPRIRNWKNLTLCRPRARARYRNINSLFSETVDWEVLFCFEGG